MPSGSDDTPGSPSPSHFEPQSVVDNNSTRSSSPEPPMTPNFAQSYGKLRQNLSFRSLRDLEIQEIHRAVWRQGAKEEGSKKSKRPRDVEQLIVHAGEAGLRAFLLGFSLRAGVSFATVCFRLTRKRGIPASVVLRAIFGSDSFRFGALLGTFTFLYKWTLHALRLFNFGRNGRGQEEIWHPAFAGALSGFAILCEKPSRRITIAQQLFVRGLQGNVNILQGRGWLKIPHGDILLFGVATGQIMYSWLLSPEALPAGYRRWVTNASRVAEPCLPINLTTYRHGTYDPEIARQSLTWKSGATALNSVLIEEYARKGEKGEFGPPFAPCEIVHPWVDTCSWTAVDRWQEVFRWVMPVYGALQVIPAILLRRKLFMNDPKRILLKAFIGTMRSSAFLATYVTIFQGLVCSQRNIYYALHGRVPEWIEKILLHKLYYWMAGFVSCVSLFAEEKKRRGELAMYVLPRAMESLWSILRRRSYVPFVPGGDVVLTATGLAMVMHTYHFEPKMLSGLVRSVLFQFVGHG